MSVGQCWPFLVFMQPMLLKTLHNIFVPVFRYWWVCFRNTCTHDCSATAVCNNTKGPLYNCTCQPGYSGDGKNCSIGDSSLDWYFMFCFIQLQQWAFFCADWIQSEVNYDLFSVFDHVITTQKNIQCEFIKSGHAFGLYVFRWHNLIIK